MTTVSEQDISRAIDPDDDTGFTRHPETVPSLADALRRAHDAIQS